MQALPIEAYTKVESWIDNSRNDGSKVIRTRKKYMLIFKFSKSLEKIKLVGGLFFKTILNMQIPDDNVHMDFPGTYILNSMDEHEDRNDNSNWREDVFNNMNIQQVLI